MTFQSWLVRVILSALLLSWFGPDSRCTGSVWTRYASSNTSRWKDLEGGAASVRLRTRCEKPFPLDHDSAFISSLAPTRWSVGCIKILHHRCVLRCRHSLSERDGDGAASQFVGRLYPPIEAGKKCQVRLRAVNELGYSKWSKKSAWLPVCAGTMAMADEDALGGSDGHGLPPHLSAEERAEVSQKLAARSVEFMAERELRLRVLTHNVEGASEQDVEFAQLKELWCGGSQDVVQGATPTPGQVPFFGDETTVGSAEGDSFKYDVLIVGLQGANNSSAWAKKIHAVLGSGGYNCATREPVCHKELVCAVYVHETHRVQGFSKDTCDVSAGVRLYVCCGKFNAVVYHLDWHVDFDLAFSCADPAGTPL
jgi:hypothetical protein